jgi:hypothetical protein
MRFMCEHLRAKMDFSEEVQLICNQQIVDSNPTAGSGNLRFTIADFGLQSSGLTPTT